MKAPLVSVVTSVYNGASGLQASLESVLNQQGMDFEVIAVNDGSTDDSGAVLNEMARHDRRLRLIHQPNQGLTQALIRGCAEARGALIARHDSDDCSLSGRLERQAKRLLNDSSLSMVSCWATALGPRDEVLWELQRTEEPLEATEQLLHHRQGPPHHGSVMFRKACYDGVGGYRPEFYFSQDSDLWLRLGEVGRIAYEPAFLYSFRVTEGSISSSWRVTQHGLGELAHACQAARHAGKSETDLLRRAALLRPGLTPHAKPDPAAGAYFIGRCLLARKDRRARQYLAKVIARKPWKIGAWTGLVRSYLFQASLTPLPSAGAAARAVLNESEIS